MIVGALSGAALAERTPPPRTKSSAQATSEMVGVLSGAVLAERTPSPTTKSSAQAHQRGGLCLERRRLPTAGARQTEETPLPGPQGSVRAPLLTKNLVALSVAAGLARD